MSMFGPVIIASASESQSTEVGGFDYDVEYAVEVERMPVWNDMVLIFNGYEKRNTRIPLEHIDSLLKALHAVKEQLSRGGAEVNSPSEKSKESSRAD